MRRGRSRSEGIARAAVRRRACDATARLASSPRCSSFPPSSARSPCRHTPSCRAARPSRHPSTFSLSVAQAQDVDVSGLATGAPLSADGYAVTTKAEIEAARLEKTRPPSARHGRPNSPRADSGSYAVYTVRAEGDDYPWWNELPDDYGGGLSPLRYYYRECVDFVAWRLNRDAGVTSAPVEVGLVEPRLGQRLLRGPTSGRTTDGRPRALPSSARSRGSRTTTSPTCSRSTPTGRSTSRSTTRTPTTRTIGARSPRVTRCTSTRPAERFAPVIVDVVAKTARVLGRVDQCARRDPTLRWRAFHGGDR